MAVYHCSASTVSRSSGRSAVAAAAYRAGERLDDTRTGLTHDYTRKGGVLHSEIVTPAGAPSWACDRGELWNRAEAAEEKSPKRATATTAREFRLALPHELDHDGRVSAVRAFARHLCDTYGVAVDFAIHAPDRDGDDRNHHAHVMLTDRVLNDAGFGGKVRGLNVANGGREAVESIRAEWAKIANRHLELAGSAERIDHRSYEARGIDAEGTKHLGPSASAMERRGEASDRGDQNREIVAANGERAALKAEYTRLGDAMTAEEQARQHRADERAERAAVRTSDPAAILDSITERRSTFTEAELAATLRKTITDPAERERLAEAILARPEIVALAEQPGGMPTRYTTEAVLQHEAEGLAAARALAADRSHAVSRATLHRIAERGEFGSMSAEQYGAFIRSTGPEGLAIIAGEAGTGKSYAAGAIRAAYEAEGGRVIGLAVTNKVIQDMQRDGFREVRTVHGALQDIARDRAGWNNRTVVVIDEAAMLSTKQLVGVLTAAKAAGAKVIAIQDQEQLGSAYARGGLAGAMQEQHPAAVSHLSEIRRIKDTAQDAAGQREAFNLMHSGRFREALGIFDRQGAINWRETQDEARAALAERYAADLDAAPGRRRFALANSNADVALLNVDLRAVHRQRGELGADHVLQTKDGPAAFATGDRIQFTGSAYHKAARDGGLANGNCGTVREIEGGRVTVELDGGKGQPGRVVSFDVGEDARAGQFNAFRHGYAGTVYRSQGSTIDVAYRLHSGAERSAASYVGATRHTEALHIFTSKEAVRGRDPWMAERGGLDGLTEAKRESAERSYQAWAEANPALGQRHGLADYVAYVQGKWAEDKAHALDLDNLARQMSRREEGRAASQFHRVERPARSFAKAAQEAAGRAQDGAGYRRAMPGRPAAPTPPTAPQTADAQRKAATIGKHPAPDRTAAALYRQHQQDATTRQQREADERKTPTTTPAPTGRAAYERFLEASQKAREAEATRPDPTTPRDRPRGRTR